MNRRRPRSSNASHATARSYAGSPAVTSPKSMIADEPRPVRDEVRRVQVAVDPDRWAGPGRGGESLVPTRMPRHPLPHRSACRSTRSCARRSATAADRVGQRHAAERVDRVVGRCRRVECAERRREQHAAQPERSRRGRRRFRATRRSRARPTTATGSRRPGTPLNTGAGTRSPVGFDPRRETGQHPLLVEHERCGDRAPGEAHGECVPDAPDLAVPALGGLLRA